MGLIYSKRKEFVNTLVGNSLLKNQSNLLLKKGSTGKILDNQINCELSDARTKIEKNLQYQKNEKRVSLYNVEDELEETQKQVAEVIIETQEEFKKTQDKLFKYDPDYRYTI